MGKTKVTKTDVDLPEEIGELFKQLKHPKKEAMINALIMSNNIVTDAVKLLVKQGLVINRAHHYYWIENDPIYKQITEELFNVTLDFAETQLFKLMKGVELPEDKIFCYEGSPVIVPTTKRFPPDTASIIFYLKTKGKKRGYIERTELSGTDGKDLFPFDWTKALEK